MPWPVARAVHSYLRDYFDVPASTIYEIVHNRKKKKNRIKKIVVMCVRVPCRGERERERERERMTYGPRLKALAITIFFSKLENLRRFLFFLCLLPLRFTSG
jgi:hypothetical protein